MYTTFISKQCSFCFVFFTFVIHASLIITVFMFSSPEMSCLSLSIVVTFDEAKVPPAIENIKNCLRVNVIGGLQITECTEMPGGILIKWDEVCFSVNLVFLF